MMPGEVILRLDHDAAIRIMSASWSSLAFKKVFQLSPSSLSEWKGEYVGNKKTNFYQSSDSMISLDNLIQQISL